MTAASASAAPPAITHVGVSAVTTGSATLEAEIDPEGKGSSYRFEYGSADCASNPCTSLPEPEGTLKAGNEAVRVSVPVSGLSPGTTYHFRVLAHSSQGVSESADRLFSPYLPEPAFAPCPANEAFRVGKPSAKLPDCRAYEQASPVDKGGLDVGGTYATVKSSPLGEAVSFYTPTGIPESSGTQEPPMHVARRGASDWATEGLLVPESFGQRSTVLGWTPDFSQVFNQVTAESFGQPNTSAFLDLQPGGSITEVVPYIDDSVTFGFAGASADGSKVFFHANNAQLTPEAAPAAGNLYVWDRDTGQTSLVGVLPDAECDSPPCAPQGGSTVGSYDWAQGSSGVGYYTQDQHAISTDGQSAYFTAGGTGQLYRRTNPTSQGAQTVRVSATEKTNGHGEGGVDSAGTSPAAFMDASTDGSKAFFTSAEKLTDDATTGPEPTVPPPSIASSDLEGTGSSVDFGFLPQRNVSALAVSGGFVFWIDPETHAIGRATLNGNDTPTDVRPKFIANPGNPQYLAADSEHLYWTNFDETEKTKPFEELGTSTIARADLDGTQVDLDFITGVESPVGIATYEGHLYWASNAPARPPAGEPSKPYETHAAIARATLNGDGPATEIEPFFIKDQNKAKDALAVGAGGIFWTSHNGPECCPQLAVFHSDLNGGNVQHYTVEEISPSSQGKDPGSPLVGLAVSASHVYWVWQEGNTIGRAELDLTNPENDFIGTPGHPRGLAIDGEHLYWSANQGAVPNPGRDLYRWEADKPASERLTDLTVDHGDENGAEVRGFVGASNDGSYLYFVANGVPDGVTGSPNAAGESASQGDCPEVFGSGLSLTCNLYLSHEGAVEFIARIEDEASWTPRGLASGHVNKTSRVSADGRTLLFSSRRQLTAYDNEGKRELYRYRVGEGLLCVSCDPTGASPESAEAASIEVVLLPTAFPARTLTRSLSTDGNRVFFESTDALVAADTDGADGCPPVGAEFQTYPSCQDVYEWEAKGEGSCESEAQNGGCLYLLSTGKSNRPSFFADASTDGDNALLVTASGLVGQDGDRLMDVYDARVDGGLAAQNETKSNCESEGCKPGASSSPGFDSPASAGFVGPPNPKARKPKARCAKGRREVRVKGKSRCVAKKHKRHRKSAEKAGVPR